MIVKEVKWELDSCDPLKRAVILLTANLFIQQFFREEPSLREMVDKPLEYTRENLYQAFVVLEDIRNMSIHQMDSVRRNSKNIMGVDLPGFSIQHAKNCNKGLEVWMCTLGAGICPEKRDEVRAIWHMLHSSLEKIPEAVSLLKEIENKTQTASIGIEGGGMFADVDLEAIADTCSYVPSSFVKELR